MVYLYFSTMKKRELQYTSDVAFTPAVKALQEKFNSRSNYAQMEQFRGWSSEVGPDLELFLAQIDSFYFGTASKQGQPYIQHRGGPKGFLRIISKNQLAFADFKGNRQFISSGNLSENNQAFIFLMDYPNRARIKLWGQAEVIYNDTDLIESLHDNSYKAQPERAILFTISAWDVNCPQHILPRYTEEDIEKMAQPLHHKIAELEKQIQELKQNH